MSIFRNTYSTKIFQQNSDEFKELISKISEYCAEDPTKFDVSVLGSLGELTRIVDRCEYKKRSDDEQMKKIDELIFTNLEKAVTAAKRRSPFLLSYLITQATQYIYIDREDGKMTNVEQPRVEECSSKIDNVTAAIGPVNARIAQIHTRMRKIETQAVDLPRDGRKFTELSQEYEALSKEYGAKKNIQKMYQDDLKIAYDGINTYREEAELNRRDRIGVSAQLAQNIIQTVERNADRYAELNERTIEVEDAYNEAHGNNSNESELTETLTLKKQAEIESNMPSHGDSLLAKKLGTKTE